MASASTDRAAADRARSAIPPVGRLLRDSTGVLAMTAAAAALQLALTVSLTHLLEPAAFGDLLVGMAALALGVNVAMLGSERSITRFLPEYLRRGDLAPAIGYLKFFLPLVSCLRWPPPWSSRQSTIPARCG